MLQEEYLYISGHGSTSQEYREKIGVFPVKLRDERNGFLFTDSNRTPILTEIKLDLTKNPPYEAPITQERQGNLSNGMPYIHFYSKILGFLKESESCLFVKTSTGLRYFGYPLMEPFPGYEESHKGVIALPVETQQTHTSLVYIKYPPDSNSGKSALLDVQTGQVLYCARDYQTYEQLYDMGVTLIGNTSMITRIPDYHTLAIMESYLLPVYDHG